MIGTATGHVYCCGVENYGTDHTHIEKRQNCEHRHVARGHLVVYFPVDLFRLPLTQCLE